MDHFAGLDVSDIERGRRRAISEYMRSLTACPRSVIEQKSARLITKPPEKNPRPFRLK